MLGCGAILARKSRYFGDPIFTIEGMSLMNPWRGNASGLIRLSLLFCALTTKARNKKTHISCLAASIYSLGGDVSDRVAKETPIPAWPTSSRDTRDNQASISS